MRKSGDRLILSERVQWPAPAEMSAAPEGEYFIGIRPHHLLPDGEGIEVVGEVKIAEISGSESIVRMAVEGNQWVSETHGIHTYEFGQQASFYFDPNRCLYFDANENRMADKPEA